MELQQAINDGAEIVSRSNEEKTAVLRVLENNQVSETLKGIGAPDGLVIILFPDSTYMIDAEISGTRLVPAEEFLRANKSVA